MEKEKKSKIDKKFFSALNENLLLNIIYSKDEKIVFRRIFQNKEENINFHLKKEEINMLKDLYEKVIKKYINTDPEDEAIINILKMNLYHLIKHMVIKIIIQKKPLKVTYEI